MEVQRDSGRGVRVGQEMAFRARDCDAQRNEAKEKKNEIFRSINVSLKYANTISVEDYNKLREAVGWEKLCREQAEQGLKHSAYIASCYDGGEAVGAARIIWDRGYIAYLADVMVLPEYQGRKIGRELVEMAIAFLKSRMKQGWKIKLVLVATKGKEAFYKKFGFSERPNNDAGAGMNLWLSQE